MDEVIPAEWRKAVCAILDGGDLGKVRLTQRALKDWESIFPDAFICDLFVALADTLRVNGVRGKKVASMAEPGETYEFFFRARRRRLYGKINLLPKGEMLIVYSAHVPLKGDSL